VEVGLQEAIDILTAATKGCGSYAKPILRHITTVAEFAKRDGVQVCNSSDLHCLSAMCMDWVCGVECCEYGMSFVSLEHHDQGIDMACLMFGYKIVVIQAQVCLSELAQQQAGQALPSLAVLVGSMRCIASKSLTNYQVNSCKPCEPG